MAKSTILIAFVALVAQLSTSWALPDADTEASEIAPYTVIKTEKTYEIRSYPATKWVCRDFVGTAFRNRDQARSFFDLFDYITGQNSAEAEIKMTAPVSLLTKPIAEAPGTNLFQMCFYIPKIHQANPPQPTSENVYIEDRPELTIAARQFGGYMRRQSDWIGQMEILRSDIKGASEGSFDFTQFYGCGYDSPMKFRDRRNEVWLLKQ